MRRLFVFLFGLILTTSIMAIDPSWNFIKGVKAIDVEFDYSQALFNNFTEDEFVTYYSQYVHEDNWFARYKKIWRTEFLSEFAEETLEKDCQAGEIPSADIKMTVSFITISDSGDMSVQIIFIDKTTNTEQKSFDIQCKGGHMGGILSLISDGHEHLGEILGKMVRRQL